MNVTPSELARHVEGRNTQFRPGDIDTAVAGLRSLLKQTPPDQVCVLKGRFHHSVTVALLNEILPVSAPAVFDPFNNNGVVRIPHAEPTQRGLGLNFEPVRELAGYTLVEFSIPGNFIKVERLPEIAPPEVNPDKGVVLSVSRGPNWLSATLALAYRKFPWVGIKSTEHDYAVVCLSNREGAPQPGTRITATTGSDAPPSTAPRKNLAFGPAKRGEIWFFNREFGPHPCVVMSHGNIGHPNSNKVSIIPFTSSIDKHFTGTACGVVVPAGTGGLDKESVALCHEIQPVSRDELTGPPLGSLSDEMMQMLVLNLTHWMRESLGSKH